MSLILDALSRSDKDSTDQKDIPDINANHGVVASAAKKKTVTVVVAAMVFIIVLLLVLLLGKKTAPVASSDNSFVPVQTLPSTTLSEVSAEPTELTKPKAVRETPSEVAQLYANNNAAPKPKIIAKIPPTRPTSMTYEEPVFEQPAAAQAASLAEDEAQALAQHIWDQTKIQPLPRRTPGQSTAVEAVPAKKEAEVAYSIKAATGTPFLHKLPVSVQNSIPSLMYAEHFYADGYVIINESKVLVGDLAAQGVTLEELREDGAIFSMGDTRFKLSAQSSWVNYP